VVFATFVTTYITLFIGDQKQFRKNVITWTRTQVILFY